MDFSETSDGDDDDETFCALSLSLSLVCEEKKRRGNRTALFLSLFLLLSLSLSARVLFVSRPPQRRIILYSRGVFWFDCRVVNPLFFIFFIFSFFSFFSFFGRMVQRHLSRPLVLLILKDGKNINSTRRERERESHIDFVS